MKYHIVHSRNELHLVERLSQTQTGKRKKAGSVE